jgi:hypothetical protein
MLAAGLRSRAKLVKGFPVRTTSAPRLTNRLTPFAPPIVVTAPETTPPSATNRFRIAVVALVLLGVSLRAAVLLADRCLWIDEAMIALNLLDRSPLQLLEPLDRNQGAPVGFLLASKLAISVFGTSEMALRFVPFLASLLGLVGFAWLAPKRLAKPVAIFAVGLFAISPALVSYAAECKQYESDAAIAIGLLAACAGVMKREAAAKNWLVFALAGAAAVWCSHPAAFVLAGLGSTVFVTALANKNRKTVLAASATIACWMLSFAACYVVSLRHLGANKYLLDYWTGHFPPVPPTSAGDLRWFVDHALGFFHAPGGFDAAGLPTAGLALLLAALGVVQLTIRRDSWAVALTLPAAFTLVAAALHRYPFAGRLLLFLVPFAILLVACGIDTLASAGRMGRWVAMACGGAIVCASTWATISEWRTPPRSEELAPVLSAIHDNWAAGDHLFVYYGAEPAFRYYERRQPFPAASVTVGEEHRGELAAYFAELHALPRGRVWVLFSHRHGNEETTFREYLGREGRYVSSVYQPGAAAYLYERN